MIYLCRSKVRFSFGANRREFSLWLVFYMKLEGATVQVTGVRGLKNQKRFNTTITRMGNKIGVLKASDSFSRAALDRITDLLEECEERNGELDSKIKDEFLECYQLKTFDERYSESLLFELISKVKSVDLWRFSDGGIDMRDLLVYFGIIEMSEKEKMEFEEKIRVMREAGFL